MLRDTKGKFLPVGKKQASEQKQAYNRYVYHTKKRAERDIPIKYSQFYQRMRAKHPNLTHRQTVNAISNYVARNQAYSVGLRKTEATLEYSP